MPRLGKPVARNRQTRVRRRHRSVEGTSYDALTPTQVANLQLWVDFGNAATLFTDTARTTPVSADAQTIKGVTDLSGNGNHLSEATVPPAYKQAIRGPRSVGRFTTAGTTKLGVASGLGTSGSDQPFSVVIAFAITAAHTFALCSPGSSAVNVQFHRVGAPDSVNWGTTRRDDAATTASLNGAAQDANWHVLSYTFTGTVGNLYIDGVQNGTADQAQDVSTFTTNLFLLGAIARSVPANFLAGDIGELAFYTGALSTGNRQTLEAYMKYKWGTP